PPPLEAMSEAVIVDDDESRSGLMVVARIVVGCRVSYTTVGGQGTGAKTANPGSPIESEKWASAGAGRPSVSAPSTAPPRTAFVISFFVIFRPPHRLQHRDPRAVPLGVAAEKEGGSRHRRGAGNERERSL